MEKIQHAKNIIPKKLIIGETCFTNFLIRGGSRGKTDMHRNHNDFFLTYMILTNKLNSCGGNVQLHFCEDYQIALHTISTRNGTIIAGVFNKIPNQTN